MKTIYATILGLTLVSGSAFAAMDSNIIADDDAAILNIGQSTISENCSMHDRTHAASTQVIDDDQSIAQTGIQGRHIAHSADVEAGLFLDDDLPL